MEDIKQEEIKVEEPSANKAQDDFDFTKVIEALDRLTKLTSEQKLMKEEIVKLKQSNPNVVEQETKPYEVDDKL